MVVNDMCSAPWSNSRIKVRPCPYQSISYKLSTTSHFDVVDVAPLQVPMAAAPLTSRPRVISNPATRAGVSPQREQARSHQRGIPSGRVERGIFVDSDFNLEQNNGRVPVQSSTQVSNKSRLSLPGLNVKIFFSQRKVCRVRGHSTSYKSKKCNFTYFFKKVAQSSNAAAICELHNTLALGPNSNQSPDWVREQEDRPWSRVYHNLRKQARGCRRGGTHTKNHPPR